MNPWTVEAAGLRVRAGRRLAVDGLDLRLGDGVHGLLGPNGAGKTTLIRALATVLPPAAGELTIFGERLSDGPALRRIRRDLGYLPQEFGYYRRFTVREFVEHIAWLKEMPGGEVPEAVQHAIEQVGLADRANARMRTLSGGMLRRVGIAQAIVNRPKLLLLDEPTVGLDPTQRMDFRALMQRLGMDSCVVVSTHLVEDVAVACTDVALLEAGQLVFQGSPLELASAGSQRDAGDSPIERGYTALLTRHRAEVGAAR